MPLAELVFKIKTNKQKNPHLVLMKIISRELSFFTEKPLTSVSCSWVIKRRAPKAKFIVTKITSYSLVWDWDPNEMFLWATSWTVIRQKV